MLDAATPPDIGSILQQLAQQFVTVVSTLLTTINTTVIEISRLAYISILLIGVLLYFTRLEKRLGKDLIKGGVVLAVLSEFVFPALNRV